VFGTKYLKRAFLRRIFQKDKKKMASETVTIELTLKSIIKLLTQLECGKVGYIYYAILLILYLETISSVFMLTVMVIK